MHIGIDARLASTIGGIGRYTHDLVDSLGKFGHQHQYSVFVYHTQDTSWIPSPIKIIKLNHHLKSNLPFVWEHFLLPSTINSYNFDLIHFPHVNVPLGYQKPYVTTIHDLSIYSHPEWFPKGQWLSTKIIVPASIKKAKSIIAVSQDINDLTAKKF